MSTPVAIIPSVATAQEAARQMDFSGVGCLIVVDAGQMVGIVTDRDLALRVLGRDLPGDTEVGRVMSADVVSVSVDDDVDVAISTFRGRAVRRLPVCDGDMVVGMLTIDDLLLRSHQILSALLGPVSSEILEPQHVLRASGGPGPR